VKAASAAYFYLGAINVDNYIRQSGERHCEAGGR
jgi:hypothetical protein